MGGLERVRKRRFSLVAAIENLFNTNFSNIPFSFAWFGLALAVWLMENGRMVMEKVNL